MYSEQPCRRLSVSEIFFSDEYRLFVARTTPLVYLHKPLVRGEKLEGGGWPIFCSKLNYARYDLHGQPDEIYEDENAAASQ